MRLLNIAKQELRELPITTKTKKKKTYFQTFLQGLVPTESIDYSFGKLSKN
jgi:hypothetical protein